MPLSKWSRRHRRTFGDKKPEPEVFLEHHRVPPKPTNYYTEEKGECRFCGGMIKNQDTGEVNKRKSWHSECADEYMLMYHPGEARKRLWQRDRGYCAGCGIVQPRKSRVHEEKWHVDHIKPLWEQKGKRFDEIDLDYWREDNLQTLCTECHTKKTSAEAAERAKLKKENK
jgi:hypothetical protein